MDEDQRDALAKPLALALKAFVRDGYLRGQKEMRERAARSVRPCDAPGGSEDFRFGWELARKRYTNAIAALPIKDMGDE